MKDYLAGMDIIPVACNRATADFMISSPLIGRSHQEGDPAPGQADRNQAALALAGAEAARSS